MLGHVRLWDGDGDRVARLDAGAFEFEASCPGDLTNDGVIGLSDLVIVLARFGEPAIPNDGDLNASGAIELEDLTMLLALFGSTCR